MVGRGKSVAGYYREKELRFWKEVRYVWGTDLDIKA